MTSFYMHICMQPHHFVTASSVLEKMKTYKCKNYTVTVRERTVTGKDSNRELLMSGKTTMNGMNKTDRLIYIVISK